MKEHIPQLACIDQFRSSGPELVPPVIAYVYNVSLDDIRAGTRRGTRAAFARQIAMYLMHVVYGLSMSEIAGTFGRDRTTACHAFHRVEDLRDDPGFDLQLLRIENLLRAAADIEVTG